MTTTIEKGRHSGKSATQTTTVNDTTLLHNKSTSGESQRQRIIKALALRPHTSYELRKMGCYQAATRINELRRLGFNIITERVSIWDDEGYPHNGIALYSLEGRS